jgi:hypothetical protein
MILSNKVDLRKDKTNGSSFLDELTDSPFPDITRRKKLGRLTLM